jgi:hypothetical protein
MAKKHWIYIKRGLSEDPKHRSQMGECIWLYMHIIDRADWETGTAFDWRDKEEAADMGMPVDTLRRQRQKLEELDYIRTKQKQHSQDVFIMEWKNPRDYGSETKNPRFEGSHESPPSKNEGGIQGSNQGLNQGSNEGSNQVQAQTPTPTLDSSPSPLSNSLSNDEDEGIQIRAETLKVFYESSIGPITSLAMDKLERAAREYPNVEWYNPAFQVMVDNADHRSWNYVEKVLQGWKEHYYGWSPASDRRPAKKVTAAQSGDHKKYVTGEYADLLEY